MNAEEAKQLLPWYAVDALDPTEARAVEEELERSSELQRELAQLRVFKSAVADLAPEEPQFRPELIDDMRQRIDTYERTQRSAWPLGVRWAMAAQFAAILVLGGLLLTQERSDEGIRTLSGGTPQEQTNDGPRLTIVFQPTATEVEIRELLETAQLQILAGPSAQQAYTLGPTAGQARDVEALLEQLRSHENLVRFIVAEPQP